MLRWLPFLLLLLPNAAHAWGPDGHRILCAIAWEELKVPVRQKVETILGIKTKEQFAEDCNWADVYSHSGHHETATWHFVDVPVGATSVDVERDCGGPQSCVVAQIEKQVRALRDGGPDVDKAMSLKFLMHFVGDEHQPLHVTPENGDKGGNAIKGYFMGREANMHQVWDSGFIFADGRPWHEIATDLRRHVTLEKRHVWIGSTPVVWANESLAIALDPTTEYVGQKNGFDFGADYVRRETRVAYERLTRAGVRLAHVLNEALSDGR